MRKQLAFWICSTFFVLYVDQQVNWRMRVYTLGENLFIETNVEHPELGNYFAASLKAKRVKSETAHDMECFFGLMPHKVAPWIYLQVADVLMFVFYIRFPIDFLLVTRVFSLHCGLLASIKVIDRKFIVFWLHE